MKLGLIQAWRPCLSLIVLRKAQRMRSLVIWVL
uniref:Uncharacterized protein n=1 Tax=Rhizophora mucronata TaxID=61149 RepID=A0A2P2QHF7_RHIMU